MLPGSYSGGCAPTSPTAPAPRSPTWSPTAGTVITVVVRLMPCRACGTALLTLVAATAPDDDPGALLVITGTEVTE